MSPRPTHVMFDLGGVLIDWNPRYLYRELIDDEAVMEDFLDRVCNQAWSVQQDAGRSTAEATAVLVQEFPEHSDLIEAYYGEFHRMWRGPIEGSVTIAADVKASGVPLVGLTNWSADTFTLAERHFDFLQWFDDIVVSGREGVIKPDPAIFHLAVERFDVEPQSTVFVDDSRPNVEAAAALGFQTHHFKEPVGLRRAFETMSLL